MSKLGTMVGVAMGFTFGGPIGAAIGGAIGAAVGTAIEDATETGNEPAPESTEIWSEDLHEAIWNSFFMVLGKFSKLDGIVSKEEIKIVKEFVKNNFADEGQDRNKQMMEHVERCFLLGRDSHKPIAGLISDFHVCLKNYKATEDAIKIKNVELFNTLKDIAFSNEPPSHIHISSLKEIAKQLGLSQKSSHQPPPNENTEEPNNNLIKHYEILKISPNSSIEEIKLARKRRLKEFHPDMHSAKELPDEFIKFANEMTIKVNAAYSAIMASRGAL